MSLISAITVHGVNTFFLLQSYIFCETSKRGCATYGSAFIISKTKYLGRKAVCPIRKWFHCTSKLLLHEFKKDEKYNRHYGGAGN